MAILFTDGFDSYGTTTGTNILTRWTSSTQPTNISSTITPFGYGQSHFCTATAAQTTASITATSTFTVGAYVYFSSLTTSGIAYGAFELKTTGTTQLVLNALSNGTIAVGLSTGTIIASSSVAGRIKPNIWYYMEFSATISDTVGTVRVDIDGETIINSTGIDTKSSASVSTVNQISLGSNNGGGVYFDDLYISDSITPLGPQRIYTLRPNADTAEKDWIPTLGWQFTSTITPISTSTNATKGHIFTALQTTNLTDVEFYFGAVAQTVKLGIAQLSSVNPGAVTSILYESSPVVRTATAGYYKFTFPAVTLNSGSIYAIYATRTDGTSTAILSLAAISSPPTTADPSGSLSYEGLINKADNSIAIADTLYASAPTTIWYMTLTYSTTNNYQAVIDPYDTDGDVSNVTASNVGDFDLYDVEAYPPASANIKGVNQIVWARKTDAATRTMNLTTKSGATTTDSTAVTLAASYAGYSRIYETDPNTASAWTVSGVNALQIGQKVAS
jgi:hypothetical protein